MTTKIAGIHNILADVASRAFKDGKFFSANQNLISYFNSHFPLQQNKSWQQFQLLTEWISRVMSCLLGKQLTMESLCRLKRTGHWVDYCRKVQMDPLLRQHTESKICIAAMAFAALVRKGSYGYGAQVKVGQVSKALAAISKTIELAGASSPLYLEKGVFKTPIARMLEGFRREDPPVVPQLAVPVEVPHTAFQTAYATSCKIERIAFYYLLHVGEYTKPKYTTVNGISRRTTRTEQFSIGNIGFFKGDTLMKVVDEEGKLLISLEKLLEPLPPSKSQIKRMAEWRRLFIMNAQDRRHLQ